MAKAKKETPQEPKKKGKYDVRVKLDMTFEEAIKRAVNTPPPKKNSPKK